MTYLKKIAERIKNMSEETKCWITIGMFFVFCLAWNIAHFF